jgi:hypothetical protein
LGHSHDAAHSLEQLLESLIKMVGRANQRVDSLQQRLSEVNEYADGLQKRVNQLEWVIKEQRQEWKMDGQQLVWPVNERPKKECRLIWPMKGQQEFSMNESQLIWPVNEHQLEWTMKGQSDSKESDTVRVSPMQPHTHASSGVHNRIPLLL